MFSDNHCIKRGPLKIGGVSRGPPAAWGPRASGPFGPWLIRHCVYIFSPVVVSYPSVLSVPRA